LNLDAFLEKIASDKFSEAGQYIRQDFIDFSDRLEKLAFDFFAHDLTKYRLNDLRKWPKYPENETRRRLNATALFTKKDDLNALISGK
jgi:hypothetical protein